MRSNRACFALGLVATIATVCTGACKKTAETQRREAAETELRSGPAEVEKHVLGEKDDIFTTVRREQLDLRARLQREIDELDRKLADLKVELRDGGYVVDPKAKHAARVKELVERRDQLHEDMLTVERADEHDWDEIKATIERDLGEPRTRGRI